MTLNCDDCLGTLKIADELLVNGDPRWCAYDLSPIIDSVEVRGSDVLIPGVPGVVTNPRRPASTTLLLPFAITGWVDSGGIYLGEEGANGRAIRAWREAKQALVGTDKTIVYTEPDGASPAVWTATGHVHALDRDEFWGGIWNGTIDIELTTDWEIS